MTTITTARLHLRPAVAADLAAIHGILTDVRAMAYWSSLPHGTLAESQAWLDNMIAIAPGTGEDFVIELAGRVIGKAGLYQFPEIGFILHPDHWGRGYAREAVAAVIDRGFAVHHLPAIIADVDPRNAASLALLTRLGFAETGRASRTYQIGDIWCDSVYLALKRPDWRHSGHLSG